jgi:hypothetical protein
VGGDHRGDRSAADERLWLAAAAAAAGDPAASGSRRRRSDLAAIARVEAAAVPDELARRGAAGDELVKLVVDPGRRRAASAPESAQEATEAPAAS